MKAQADRPCSVLAYGDVKRVELAIAMANAPKLLLMDEPTAGMAPKERRDLMALTNPTNVPKLDPDQVGNVATALDALEPAQARWTADPPTHATLVR